MMLPLLIFDYFHCLRFLLLPFSFAYAFRYAIAPLIHARHTATNALPLRLRCRLSLLRHFRCHAIDATLFSLIISPLFFFFSMIRHCWSFLRFRLLPLRALFTLLYALMRYYAMSAMPLP